MNPNGQAGTIPESGDQTAATDFDTLLDKEFEEIADDQQQTAEPVGEELPGEGDQEPSGEGRTTTTDTATTEAKPPVRKWAGQYDTPEEMEAAYIRGLQRQDPATQKPAEPVDELPDLNEAEMNTLAEQDGNDGTEFSAEYLRKKMQTRNLHPHEVKVLRKLDDEKGTDLLGDYHELRALRRVQAETAPLVRRSREESVRAYETRERSIDKTNEGEFGERLGELETFCGDPKNVEIVLQRSPIAHLIINEHQRSPATAHKLLLREADSVLRSHREATIAGKNKRSVPADVGASGRVKGPRDSAATVEEAFAMAEDEQQ